jgi:hypothetical protein
MIIAYHYKTSDPDQIYGSAKIPQNLSPNIHQAADRKIKIRWDR